MEYFKKLFKQILDFFMGLSPGKRVALLGTMTAIGVGLVMTMMWASKVSYRPLMTNLSTDDSAAIMRILRDKKIPFQVDPSGRNVEVPPEYIDQMRLEFATMGLPDSSVVGYEIFDKQSLGTTSFVQAVNQTRALEGELMRTISAIKGVKRARVHLAIPKKSTFVEDSKPSTASVVMDLEPGIVLSEKQVYGVGRLVSSAVPGLEASDVVIVDSNGKQLSKNVRDPLVAMTASQLDFQRKIEDDLEKRIEGLLNPIIGEGRVVATVSAELDFSQVSETKTEYDADAAAVRSSQKNNESLQMARPGPYGAAGAISNTPGDPPRANGGDTKSDTNRVRETTNFAVPQTTRRTQKPSGSISKLSVAVVVDGKTVTTKDDKGLTLSKIEPWAPEKLAEFERVIAGSVGLDTKRGDKLEIRNLEFLHADLDDADRIIKDSERRAYFMNLTVYAVVGLVILLFFMFVVRPFIKWMTENTIDSVDAFLPQTIEELEKLQKNQVLPGLEEVMPELPEEIDPRKVEGEMIKEKIITMVDSNPHKAALILKDWIRADKKDASQSADKGKSA